MADDTLQRVLSRKTNLNNTLPPQASITNQQVPGVGTNPFAFGHLAANRFNDAANQTRLFDIFTQNQAAIRGHEMDMAGMAGRQQGGMVLADLMKGGNAGFPFMARNEQMRALQIIADLLGAGQIPLGEIGGTIQRNQRDLADSQQQQAGTLKDVATAAGTAPPTENISAPFNGQNYTIDPTKLLEMQRAKKEKPPTMAFSYNEGPISRTLTRSATDQEINQSVDAKRAQGLPGSQPLGEVSDDETKQRVMSIINGLSQIGHDIVNPDGRDPMTGDPIITAFDRRNNRNIMVKLSKGPSGESIAYTSYDDGNTWKMVGVQ